MMFKQFRRAKEVSITNNENKPLDQKDWKLSVIKSQSTLCYILGLFILTDRLLFALPHYTHCKEVLGALLIFKCTFPQIQLIRTQQSVLYENEVTVTWLCFECQSEIIMHMVCCPQSKCSVPVLPHNIKEVNT